MTEHTKEEILTIFRLLISTLEQELRLPKGTAESLVTDNDWSAIIKSSAIVEAALGDTIRRLLSDDALQALEKGWEKSLGGKLKVAKSHGLLSRLQLDGLYALMELRNLCAHDRSALGFTLEQHFAVAAARNKFERLFNRLAWTPEEEAKLAGQAPLEVPQAGRPIFWLLTFVFSTCIDLLTKKVIPARGVH
jgi:hypothetical protein